MGFVFYGRKRWVSSTYGRNTVPTKRMFHGPYTVVIVMYTNVYVIVNDGKPPFMIVVMFDLGIYSNVNY